MRLCSGSARRWTHSTARGLLACALGLLTGLSIGPTLAERPAKPEAAGWRVQAQLHLQTIDAAGRPVPLEPVLMFGNEGWRCPRLNNYWCLKSGSTPWPGMVGKDSDGHALFTSPLDSAVAMIRIMRRYYLEQGRTTLEAIVCRFAPNADCRGSGKGMDKAGVCMLGQNNCRRYAETVGSFLGMCADCDAKLFDRQGRAAPTLLELMRQMSSIEISHYDWNLTLYPARNLIARAIKKEQEGK